MALIEAEGVHVRFGDRVVLEEINLAVDEGELPRRIAGGQVQEAHAGLGLRGEPAI